MTVRSGYVERVTRRDIVVPPQLRMSEEKHTGEEFPLSFKQEKCHHKLNAGQQIHSRISQDVEGQVTVIFMIDSSVD